MATRRFLNLPRVLPFRDAQRFGWLRQVANKAAQDVKLFDKILVANRGEIACRVMQTTRRLGIRTVAVYSEADRNAMHVAMADEAHCIGPAPSSESYLRQDRIMEVAMATRAQAIHPGYGFLSENKNFAELCQSNGIEFIGPPASAIEKMGTKRVSKEIMSESSVPVVPGYFGDDQSDQKLKEEAEKLGFPVLIKADLGGGGKGMRIVHNSADFQQALDSCRSEALKSFGDDKVLIEKLVDKPRHVEVQVFGDKHGNVLHLFERDCSVQRRHQKIIEEAPAPGLYPHTKEQIWSAAVRAAKAVDYVGAGTVEFIMDSADQSFYFMEMNTRLQVEHPVTEMITGQDLVEWQIRVAAGATLPINQSDLTHRGHAFEARIYAEKPEYQEGDTVNFIPSPGLLQHLVIPPSSDNVRIDTGVRQGDEVSEYYDPMIAKLVVWGQDRTAALKKLTESLQRYQVAGVGTNIEFLGRLSSHETFVEGDVHTGFIEQHISKLFPPSPPLSEFEIAQGVLALLALEERRSEQTLANQNDPFSPFGGSTGGRLNSKLQRHVSLDSNSGSFVVAVTYHGDGSYSFSCGSDQEPVGASGRLREEGGVLVLHGYVGQRQVAANVALIGDSLHVFTVDGGYSVELPKPAYLRLQEAEEGGGTRSPKYPSTVSKVHVEVGDEVKKGSVLMTVEGMKMETHIVAAKDGRVKTVFYALKDNVPKFSKVIEFEED